MRPSIGEALPVQWVTLHNIIFHGDVVHWLSMLAYMGVYICVLQIHDQTLYLHYGCQPVSGVILPGLKLVQYLIFSETSTL